MMPWLHMWHLGMMGGRWCFRLWATSREVDKVTKPYLTNTEMVSTLTMSREVLTPWKQVLILLMKKRLLEGDRGM